jgi:hypothetical protein
LVKPLKRQGFQGHIGLEYENFESPTFGDDLRQMVRFVREGGGEQCGPHSPLCGSESGDAHFRTEDCAAFQGVAHGFEFRAGAFAEEFQGAGRAGGGPFARNRT